MALSSPSAWNPEEMNASSCCWDNLGLSIKERLIQKSLTYCFWYLNDLQSDLFAVVTGIVILFVLKIQYWIFKIYIWRCLRGWLMKSSNRCGCAAELWETASQRWGLCGRRGLVCPYSLERWEMFQGCWNNSWKELSRAAASGFAQRTILVPELPLGLSWAHSLCSNPVGMAEELLLWHWDVRSPPLWTCSGTMASWDQGLLEDLLLFWWEQLFIRWNEIHIRHCPIAAGGV